MKWRGREGKMVWARMSLIFLLVVSIGAVVWLTMAIQNVRQKIEQVRIVTEKEVTGAVTQAILSNNLSDRQADLELLSAFIPTGANISEVVSQIEREAARRDLTLNIPTVAKVDPEANGPRTTDQVVFNLNVTGEEEAVWQFLHAVEMLPFLSRVENFEFMIEEELAPRGLTSRAPDNAIGDGPTPAKKTSARLNVEMYLTVLNSSSE